jgi:hypothetical protein
MVYDVRVPGYGGAGVFLRKTIAGDPPGSTAVDVWLLGPGFCSAILGRATETMLYPDLAKYLFDAASNARPEQALLAFQDLTAGLSIDVGTSDEARIGLRVRIVDDPDAPVIDYLEIDFETSRAALVTSAESIAEFVGGIDLADFSGLK